MRLWTSKEVQFLRDNWGELTSVQMAARLGRTPRAVYTAMVRMREKLASRGVQLKPLQRPRVSLVVSRAGRAIARLNAAGHSDADVAAQLGLTRKTVRKARALLGLPSNRMNARHRAKLSAHGKDLVTRRVSTMLEAERMGWPGRTLGEARVLEALRTRGELTRSELAAALGVKWCTGGRSIKCRVDGLIADGLVVRAPGGRFAVVRDEEE